MEILQELPEKERKIIEMRNGLNDGIYHTLEDVGKEFGHMDKQFYQDEKLLI